MAGLDQEGIFRINGNARVVDRIRASFDSHGDADLGVNSGVSGFNGADMTALASALKLFLRELPDGLIPEENTRVFISTQHGRWHCQSLTAARRLVSGHSISAVEIVLFN